MDDIYTESVRFSPRRKPGISDQARYHNELRRRVLEHDPGVTRLAGPDWRTAAATVLLLALYWGMAFAVSKTNWLVVFIAAFCFGQFVHHAGAALVHESAHKLVFRGRRAKLAYDLLIETLMTTFARQLSYHHEHVTSHHAHLNDYEGDWEHEDIYRVAARKLYREQHPARSHLLNLWVSTLHLLPYGYFVDAMTTPRFLARATGLPLRDKLRDTGATKPAKWEVRLFMLYSLFVYVSLFYMFGFLGWLFHTWSMSIVLGRWGISIRGQFISEHSREDVPTRSTYGWVNWFVFNSGYHHEHHTFSNIAWTRLPKLKASAPHIFKEANTRSYLKLWWDQMKAEFELPKRPSARDPEGILRHRVEQGAGPVEDFVPTVAVAA